jgi:hypothetical protein
MNFIHSITMIKRMIAVIIKKITEMNYPYNLSAIRILDDAKYHRNQVLITAIEPSAREV